MTDPPAAWPQCPYIADDGGGRCIRPDYSGSHRMPSGVVAHVCWDGRYQRAGRNGGSIRTPYRAYRTSKRDAGRWARQEEGKDICPRWSVGAGVRCRLLDVPELHDRGHEGQGAEAVHAWGTDREDTVRWARLVLAVPPLPPADPSLPTPPGWERQGGDYVFAYQQLTARTGRADPELLAELRADRRASADARAREQIAAAGLTVLGRATDVEHGYQQLLWYRTGLLGPRVADR